MHILYYISELMIPLIIFYIVGYGIIVKANIYDDFVKGAADSFKTVIQIMPTLIGLMVAVGILRASGFLEFISTYIGIFTNKISFPAELVPLSLIRMFSSSAATGIVLDIFQEFGPDSKIGTMASIIVSCTESCFYTMSVYFVAAKVTKSRYTLAGAILATAAGIGASVFLTNKM